MDNETPATTTPSPVAPVTSLAPGDGRLAALENRVEEIERVLGWAREKVEAFATGPGGKVLAGLGLKL